MADDDDKEKAPFLDIKKTTLFPFFHFVQLGIKIMYFFVIHLIFIIIQKILISGMLN